MTADIDQLIAARGAEYGDPIDDFVRVQQMYEAWLTQRRAHESPNHDRAHKHGVYLILVKLSRLAHSPYHEDSLRDIAGYVRCLQGCAPTAEVRP